MPCIQSFKHVRPWALGLETRCKIVCFIGPTTWAGTSLDAQPKPKDHNGAIVTRTARAKPYQSNFGQLGAVITWEHETLNARYCLGEYRYQIALMRWEPVPMPLLSHLFLTKHPLTDNGIRPPFPLTIQDNHCLPLILSYK